MSTMSPVARMRQPMIRRASPSQARAQQASTPAPVGGWNTRDPFGDMPEQDATVLVNWWPTASYMLLRRGYQQHTTGLATVIESLMPYNRAASGAKIFGASGTAFYNLTSSGAVGAAVVTGLTNARWESINFTNSSGTTYLCCFNGTDAPQYWDNSAWTAITGVSTPAITGVTATTLHAPCIFKRRIFLAQKNTNTVWFLPVDAVGGAAASFTVDGIFHGGGSIAALGTWTLDAGAGVDDHFVIVSSEGEIAIYKGTDPSSANTWALVGVWQMGRPLGAARCLIQLAGDLVYLSTDGVMSLSKTLQVARTKPETALSSKIQLAMRDAAALYGSNYGWGMMFYPDAQMLLVNVPVSATVFEQYVMNTSTGAWARFTGINAKCWAMFGGVPYGGMSTYSSKLWQVDYDEAVAGVHAQIRADVQQAATYFGKRGLNKRVTAIRPVFLSQVAPGVLVAVNTGFSQSAPLSDATFNPGTAYSTWDSGVWDTAVWGGDLSLWRGWQTAASKVGMAVSLRMITRARDITVQWHGCDWVYELGGTIG